MRRLAWTRRAVVALAVAAAGLGLAGGGAPARAASAPDLSAYQTQAREVLQRLRAETMVEMQRAMQVGPAAAIGVCRHLAPDIQARIERETGWTVKRTSLKVRNPANAPTADEARWLRLFEVRAAAGQPVPLLGGIELLPADTDVPAWQRKPEGARPKLVHVVQAIPMFETCVACHGKNIAPNVAAEIGKLYPHDQATGYAVGDIRGLFSLTIAYDPKLAAKPAVDAEWAEVAALELPASATITDATGETHVTDPRAGRAAFKTYCTSCHGAADLARRVAGPPPAERADEKTWCGFLAHHGQTEPAKDCDIIGFLKTVGPMLKPAK